MKKCRRRSSQLEEWRLSGDKTVVVWAAWLATAVREEVHSMKR